MFLQIFELIKRAVQVTYEYLVGNSNYRLTNVDLDNPFCYDVVNYAYGGMSLL